MASNNSMCVFLFSGDFDRMHQGLSLAVSGADEGREVGVYFFRDALDRLIADDLDAAMPGGLTLRQLLEAGRATTNLRLYADRESLVLLDKDSSAVLGKVDELLSLPSIFDRTSDITNRFCL
jgi:peroxiredoxin family protein